jgi:flagellar basal body rod protein FlgF
MEQRKQNEYNDMSTGQMITTTRDIDAILIPLGTPVIIPENAQVAITQEMALPPQIDRFRSAVPER